MSEWLKIFDENENEIGVTSRTDVHKKGYWHETFHCWLVETINDVDYIYFQMRSSRKKDYPELFDTTAAGHLLADEDVTDGVREISEELGIEVRFEDLNRLGTIRDRIVSNNFIDQEMAHVHLYRLNDEDEFKLQVEEVSGMFKTPFNHFYDLCLGKRDTINASGFIIQDSKEKISVNRSISLTDFVPHERSYFEKVVKAIAELL